MSNNTCIKNVQATSSAGFQKQNPFFNTKTQKTISSSKSKKESGFQAFLDTEIDKLNRPI
jgi:hypothetical protein